jgi:AraC-like DNA-binding protein
MKSDSKNWKIGGLPEFEFLWDRGNLFYAHHVHEGFNIDFVQSGVLEYRIGVRTLLAHPGDLVWIDRHEVHEARSLTKDPMVRSLLLSERFVISLGMKLKMRKAGRLIHPVIRDEQLSAQIESIHRIAEAPFDKLEIDTLLTTTLSDILVRDSSFETPLTTENDDHAGVNKVKEYLLAYYEKKISLRDLAEMVDLNPSYLVRVFRNHVGVPPYEFLTQIRMARARNLLSAGMSPANVAAAVGLSDQSHLTRMFKRSTGMTPGSYAQSQLIIQ